MPENAKRVLAENLVRLIRSTGRSQAELSAELGLKQSTVSDWINAKKYPRIDKLQLLADYFGVLRSELTEVGMGRVEPAPGTAEWLRAGLVTRRVKGAAELSDAQLDALLKNMDMLAQAFFENGRQS